MSAYEKYRYGDQEQPENGYLADRDSSAYFTPTDRESSGIPAGYDHGWCFSAENLDAIAEIPIAQKMMSSVMRRTIPSATRPYVISSNAKIKAYALY